MQQAASALSLAAHPAADALHATLSAEMLLVQADAVRCQGDAEQGAQHAYAALATASTISSAANVDASLSQHASSIVARTHLQLSRCAAAGQDHPMAEQHCQEAVQAMTGMQAHGHALLAAEVLALQASLLGGQSAAALTPDACKPGTQLLGCSQHGAAVRPASPTKPTRSARGRGAARRACTRNMSHGRQEGLVMPESEQVRIRLLADAYGLCHGCPALARCSWLAPAPSYWRSSSIHMVVSLPCCVVSVCRSPGCTRGNCPEEGCVCWIALNGQQVQNKGPMSTHLAQQAALHFSTEGSMPCRSVSSNLAMLCARAGLKHLATGLLHASFGAGMRVQQTAALEAKRLRLAHAAEGTPEVLICPNAIESRPTACCPLCLARAVTA